MSLFTSENHSRRFVAMMLVYLTFMSGIFTWTAYRSVKDGFILKVVTNNRKISNYKHQKLQGNNYFISGMEGDLYWRPANLTEAMLLKISANKSVDFLDITGVLIVAGIVLYMFKDSGKEVIFSKGMASGFMALAFAIGIMGTLLDMARMQLAIYYVPYVTHGQFRGSYNFKVVSFVYMIYPLLIFLIRLPQKGLALQKEAELTI